MLPRRTTTSIVVQHTRMCKEFVAFQCKCVAGPGLVLRWIIVPFMPPIALLDCLLVVFLAHVEGWVLWLWLWLFAVRRPARPLLPQRNIENGGMRRPVACPTKRSRQEVLIDVRAPRHQRSS